MIALSLFLILNFLFLVIFFILFNISFKINLLDFPDNRKIHSQPIPTIGGLLIYITLIFFSFFYEYNNEIIIFIYVSSIIILIGFLDDLFEINYLIRLIIQTISCLIIIYYGTYIKSLGDYTFQNSLLFNIDNLKLSGVILSVFALLCLVNAFNFIDGIDGLASSLIIISGLTLLAFSFIYSNFIISSHIFLILFIYLNFLFLVFNKGIFLKFKIFYGDTGSTLIGFVFGWILIHYADTNQSFIHPVLAIWCITLPIYDFLYVIIHRIQKKVNPFKPDNNHIHHILLEKLNSNNKTLIIIILISLFLNSIGILTFYFVGSFVCLIIYVFLFILYFFSLNKIRYKF